MLRVVESFFFARKNRKFGRQPLDLARPRLGHDFEVNNLLKLRRSFSTELWEGTTMMLKIDRLTCDADANKAYNKMRNCN
jgi:hypothetical protein